MVKRYSTQLLSNYFENPGGRFVMFTDYQSLEAENDKLNGLNAALDLENKELKEELSKYQNGYKGGCYACETVGETNVRLRKALKEIVEHGESDCYVIALHALEGKDE